MGNRASRCAGFTFLELLLVLVVMSLIAGLTLPLFSGVLDRTERQAALREIASAMRYARSQAVAAKTPITFRADLVNNKYWLENKEEESVSKVKTLPAEVVFAEYTSGEDSYQHETVSILFYPRGNTSGGILVLKPKGDRKRDRFEIHLDPVTGKPEVQSHEE
jgi:type II secretion system protein H